jgi:hypothetical protein
MTGSRGEALTLLLLLSLVLSGPAGAARFSGRQADDPDAGERRVVPAQLPGTWRNGMFLSTSGSLGRPSTRSPMMLRWIWLVPPPMDVKKAR